MFRNMFGVIGPGLLNQVPTLQRNLKDVIQAPILGRCFAFQSGVRALEEF